METRSARPALTPAAAARRRRPHSAKRGIKRTLLPTALLAFVLFASAATIAWLRTPAGNDLAQRVAARARSNHATLVPLRAIAPALQAAVIATEDERFYRHHGIDSIGLLRAIPYDVSHFSLRQGGSTITEQLAKILYLAGNDHSPWRKLQDAAIALKLESHYAKRQLLTAYLNSVYFGEGAYGAEAAAHRYFGRSAQTLTLAQASLLAGLIQAPSRYDPFRRPDLARGRQLAVLRSLVRTHALSPPAARRALARPLALASAPPLAAVPEADVDPGSPFAWDELGFGFVLAMTGVFMLRPRIGHRPPLSIAVAVALLALGAVLAARSFRTL